MDDWRAKWDAPGRLAIAANDRILPLDLTQPADTEELRRTLGRGNGSTVLTEVFPEPTDMWLSDDSDGRFAAEFVVPLIRRTPIPAPGTTPTTRTCDVELRTPGSDWLFVKLYVGHYMEEDLLRGPIRELTRELADVDFTEWFFIRYTDTGPHVRLRFHGDPARLVAELLPRILYWATGLTTSGACLRYAIDTYERETARFGGPGAMSVAEDLFTADSGAVLDLLSLDMSGQLLPEPLPIAALTVDALLSGLGLPAGERAEWYAMRAGSRRESGQDYRRWKATLRPLLADSHPFPPLDAVLCRLREAGASARTRLAELVESGGMTGAPADLYGSLIHLHLNRLLRADQVTERRIYGLLLRLHHGLAVAGGPRPSVPIRSSGMGGWPLANEATAPGQKIEIARPVNIVAGPSGRPISSATLAATSATSWPGCANIGQTCCPIDVAVAGSMPVRPMVPRSERNWSVLGSACAGAASAAAPLNSPADIPTDTRSDARVAMRLRFISWPS